MLDELHPVPSIGHTNKGHEAWRFIPNALDVKLNCTAETNQPRADLMLIVELGLECLYVLRQPLERGDYRVCNFLLLHSLRAY